MKKKPLERVMKLGSAIDHLRSRMKGEQTVCGQKIGPAWNPVPWVPAGSSHAAPLCKNCDRMKDATTA